MGIFQKQTGKTEEHADPVRRKILIAGSSLVGLVLLKGFWNSFNLLTEEPPKSRELKPAQVIEGQQSTQMDPDFQKFKDIFHQGPMSYDQAIKIIMERTGMEKIKPHHFNLSDPLHLTEAKRFFSITPVFMEVPERLAAQVGFRYLITSVSNGVIYNTPNYTNDGRLRALADYILTKTYQKAKKQPTALNAASALADWVCKNISLDMEHMSLASVRHPSVVVGSGERWRKEHNVGVSHSFDNSISIIQKGGICYDFSNILVDLQNSLGIPSRTVAIARHGITQKNGKAAFSSYGHSLVQTFLGEGCIYGDPTPLKSSKGMDYNPGSYAGLKELVGSLTSPESGVDIYYLGINGAIPEEQVPEELKTILTIRPFDYVNEGFLKAYSIFLKDQERSYPNEPEKQQLLYAYSKPREDGTKVSF